MVDGDGRGDLEEPDQLEPAQPLAAGVIGMDLREPGVMTGSAVISPSMWANRKKPRTPCIMVLTEEFRTPVSCRWRMAAVHAVHAAWRPANPLMTPGPTARRAAMG